MSRRILHRDLVDELHGIARRLATRAAQAEAASASHIRFTVDETARLAARLEDLTGGLAWLVAYLHVRDGGTPNLAEHQEWAHVRAIVDELTGRTTPRTATTRQAVAS